MSNISINVKTRAIWKKECGRPFRVMIDVTIDEDSILDFEFEIIDKTVPCKFDDSYAYDDGTKTKRPRPVKKVFSEQYFYLAIQCAEDYTLRIKVVAKDQQGSVSNEDTFDVALNNCSGGDI